VADVLIDRIHGSLAGAVIGDAMGAPFEGLTRAEIAERSGGLVTDLVDPWPGGPADGNARGQVTDDASQLLMLARLLVETGGEPSDEAWERAIVDWMKTSPQARFAGPTTRAIIEVLAGGKPPDRSGIEGVTNGAAMRVAPCGLVNPGDASAAAELAWLTARPTHDTSVAAAAAGAVAAGVAEALRPEAAVATVLAGCADGAALGEELGALEGRRVPGPSVGHRIERALEVAGGDTASTSEAAGAGGTDLEAAIERIAAAVGTGYLAVESVPAAIGVFAAAGGDPMKAIAGGASIGGDTDTIASIAGAIAGALRGVGALPAELVAGCEAANDVDLGALARELAEVTGRQPA
jgi:ADP-ribosylglycohydrolase